MLSRRQQRHLKYLLTGTGVFLLLYVIVSFIHPSNHSHQQTSSEDYVYDFYHSFALPDSETYKVLSSLGKNPLFKNGRRRTLNTSYGQVYVKDLMFVPKKLLPKGANLYNIDIKGNNEDLSKKLSMDRNKRRRLGNRSKEKGRTGDVNLSDQQNKSTCSKAPCKEFLSAADIPHYKYCHKKSRLWPDYEPPVTTCTFRQPDPSLPLVALASSPGSGADLLRWLLQEVTGLCTGSVRCSVNLRKTGYAGECVRSTSVLIVKIDQIIPIWSLKTSWFVPKGFKKLSDVPVFKSAVYLIRNPYDSILDEWYRQSETTDSGKSKCSVLKYIASKQTSLILFREWKEGYRSLVA